MSSGFGRLFSALCAACVLAVLALVVTLPAGRTEAAHSCVDGHCVVDVGGTADTAADVVPISHCAEDGRCAVSHASGGQLLAAIVVLPLGLPPVSTRGRRPRTARLLVPLTSPRRIDRPPRRIS